MCDFEHPDRSCLGGHGGPFTLLTSRKLSDEEWSLLDLDQTWNYLTGEFDPHITMLVINAKFPEIEFELHLVDAA